MCSHIVLTPGGAGSAPQKERRKMRGFQRREITPNRGGKEESSEKKGLQHRTLEVRPN